MLTPLIDMPDEASIWVLVASRNLTEEEESSLRDLTDKWLGEWQRANAGCRVSASQALLARTALVWAVDTRCRQVHGAEVPLTGTDLDPLLEHIDRFTLGKDPPLTMAPNEALVVRGRAIPLGPEWLRLAQEGGVTQDTLILHQCKVADWRAGRLIHRLGDDSARAREYLSYLGLDTA